MCGTTLDNHTSSHPTQEHVSKIHDNTKLQTIVFKPKFELLNTLNFSTKHTIHMAQNTDTQEYVAVKTIAYSSRPFKSIYDELQILYQLSGSHCSALTYITMFEDSERVSFVTEYCETDLLTFTENHQSIVHQQFWNIAQQMTEAIAHIQGHNMIHCNLKLSKWCLKHNRIGVIQLTGFENALLAHQEDTVMDIRGTLTHLSPQAFVGVYNDYTDMWGIGICLYTMIYSFLPFQYRISSLDELDEFEIQNCLNIIYQGLPVEEDCVIGSEAISLIQTLMSIQPEHRFTAHELCCALDDPLKYKKNHVGV